MFKSEIHEHSFGTSLKYTGHGVPSSEFALRAWADALRVLRKHIPAWIPEAPRSLLDQYWSHTRRIRNLAEKTFKEHRLYITWFLEDLKSEGSGSVRSR